MITEAERAQIGWLAKQAASYILPMKRKTVQTKTQPVSRDKPDDFGDEDEKGAVQSAHRYGRKPT